MTTPGTSHAVIESHRMLNASAIGRVALVGAGPGDMGLITVRGLRALEQADVVVFDRLIDQRLLDHASAHAELIDAGKGPGNHTLEQVAINALLVDRALAGARVVRLKGGDPFIFGRGHEEFMACESAGVACEVIPGVTSAIAAPAAAGIPVTLRGVARSFVIVTPQGESGMPIAPLDYTALAKIDTISVLMGVQMLGDVAAGLLRAGREPETPVAIIEVGTLPDQRVTRATLATIESIARETGVGSPAVIVIGQAAGLAREPLRVTSRTHPLAGKRVLVTRPTTSSSELVEILRARGANVVECPLIQIEYVTPSNASVLRERFDWTVFTSLHAVRGLWRLLREQGLDARALAGTRVAAVGPKTARELEAVGVHADVVPDVHRASGLIAAITAITESGGDGMGARRGTSTTVLFPCGTLAREELPMGLRAGGCEVIELDVYETVSKAPSVHARRAIERGLDIALFYSPSAVQGAIDAGLTFPHAIIGCIGPTTAEAALRLGLRADVVADVHTDLGLVDAVTKRLSSFTSSRQELLGVSS